MKSSIELFNQIKKNPMSLSNTFHKDKNHQYHNIESNSFTFLNRNKELDELHNYHRVLRNRLISLSGEAGAGKTSLAKHYAKRLLNENNPSIHSIIWATAKEKELIVSNRSGSSYFKLDNKRRRRINSGVFVTSLQELYSAIMKVSGHPKEIKKSFFNPIKIKYTEQEVYDWLKIRECVIFIDDIEGWKDKWGSIVRFAELVPHPSSVIITSRWDLLGTVQGLARIKLNLFSKADMINVINNTLSSNQIQISSSVKDEILNFANGNPLLAKLACGFSNELLQQNRTVDLITIFRGSIRNNRPKEFIFDSLLIYLTPLAKEILVLIALLKSNNKKVDELVLVQITGEMISYVKNALKELENTSLINRNESDNDPFDIHDLVKEFAINNDLQLTDRLRLKI